MGFRQIPCHILLKSPQTLEKCDHNGRINNFGINNIHILLF